MSLLAEFDKVLGQASKVVNIYKDVKTVKDGDEYQGYDKSQAVQIPTASAPRPTDQRGVIESTSSSIEKLKSTVKEKWQWFAVGAGLGLTAYIIRRK